MRRHLECCPFCGEAHELRLYVTPHYRKVLVGEDEQLHAAQIRCEHCAARGTNYIEEDKQEAVNRAFEAWNAAPRPRRRHYPWLRWF